MVVNAFVFETRGGATIAEFDPKALDWSWSGNEPETVTATVDLNSPVELGREWRSLGSAWNHCIAIDVGGRYLGGPIMPHDFSDNEQALTLTARGFRMMLAQHRVLPAAARTVPLVDPNTGVIASALNSNYANLDYGSIGAQIVRQALTWPSWSDILMDLPADRTGKRFQSYQAVDLVDVDKALADLSNLENGPDIRFEIYRVDGNRFGWRYLAGTESEPRLSTGSEFSWEIGKASDLTVKTNPLRMASMQWSVGGRAEDRTMVEALYDPYMVDRGGMLLHQQTEVDANESDPLELRRWNAEAMRTSRQPWEFWSFSVPANETPLPSEYGPGDLIEVIVPEGAQVAGGYVKPGKYKRRIASLSGGTGDRISITCGENYDG